MERLQVQVDELLVELGALLAKLMDDMLEVADADVSADRFEVRHHFLTREGFDFVQVGSKDLHHMTSDQRDASCDLKSRKRGVPRGLLPCPARRPSAKRPR